jgi:N-acetylglucosamine-6-phosphate deacetylase
VPGVVIAAPQVLTADGIVADASVVVEDGRIAAVRPAEAADAVLPEGILAPGLIDLQVNGFFGIDFGDATADEWRAVAQRLPETGVTAFLPTLITAPIAELVDGLRCAGAAMGGDGARILGVHVEGPFLAEARRGAHDAGLFCDPTRDRIAALLEPGTLALLTLAPERDGALLAIERLAQAGVPASIGHSDATAAVVLAAAAAGARMVTHLFNAQRGIHHREPGVAGMALADPRLICGLILDGHHVADAVARIALAAAPGRIALVTDAIAAAGMPPGLYELGGEPVIVREGEPPKRPDGTLAGASLRLDDAVARAVALGMSPAAAIDAATRVPAGVLGRSDLGRIAPGAAADLVWLGPDFRARATWVGGELVHGTGGVVA